MSLYDEYNKIARTLKPQIQGTCGLYSFWYATLLLRSIDPTNRVVVYPRSSEGTSSESLRHYAKHTLSSGQGEVLTSGEMRTIIEHFGYHCETHTGKTGRKEFITTALANDRPVLFPYMMGNSGPISSFPPKSTGGVDYGSHWSLIISESVSEYFYIEPNRPNTLKNQLKSTVLNSNSFVDNYKYGQYWEKTKTSTGKSSIEPTSWIGGTLSSIFFKAKIYDIAQNNRSQTLANLLVSVF